VNAIHVPLFGFQTSFHTGLKPRIRHNARKTGSQLHSTPRAFWPLPNSLNIKTGQA
jgi:hypothetical protein